MSENAAPAGAGVKPAGPNGVGDGAATAGIPFYEKERQHLKSLIAQRRALEKRLVRVLILDDAHFFPVAVASL
jgi:chromatin modification-related protein EAF6